MTIRQMYDLRSPTPLKLEAGTPDDSGYKIDSNEIIGIEVEVENINGVGRIRSMWQSKHDNSLRNNGVEFVSLPIRASDAPAALYSLMTETLGKDACFSPRTSVHVHLNFTDNEPEDVFNMVMLYAVFERLFYKMVGRQRIKNIYCVPLTETNLIPLMALRGAKPDFWHKYAGLNLKPLADYGTVEFRHMHGTADVQKLCVWIDLITKLKAYCLKQGSSHLRPLIASMDDNFDFEKLLREIFGSTADYLKYTALDDVRFTYPVAKILVTKTGTTQLTLAREVSADSEYFMRTVD